VISILSEFHHRKKDESGKPSSLRSLTDHIFATLAFPVSIYVTSVYWSSFMINEEITFPKKAQEVVPRFLFIIINVLVSTTSFFDISVG
jgi:hypothetical protein